MKKTESCGEFQNHFFVNYISEKKLPLTFNQELSRKKKKKNLQQYQSLLNSRKNFFEDLKHSKGKILKFVKQL